MKNQTIFYVSRHGQTEFNLKGIIGGTLEPNPLSPKGEEQAKLLSKNLKHVSFDKIYSSKLLRAIKTAEIIASSQNLPVETDELLNERNWGSLQGVSFNEAKKIYPKAFIAESKIEGKNALTFKYVKDIESLHDTVNRFQLFLNKTVKTNRGKTILLVCHFDLMIGYLFSIGYGTYQNLMNATFDHTGFYKLIYDEDKFIVEKIIGLKIKK